MDSKLKYQFIMFCYLIAASCFAVATFIHTVNGVIFVAVINAILVPLNLFLACEAFKKMIKEK